MQRTGESGHDFFVDHLARLPLITTLDGRSRIVMKRTLAYLAGPIIWLIVYGLSIVLGFVFWDMNPDSFVAMAVVAYIASGMGSYIAFEAMRRIHPTVRDVSAYLVLGAFAFLWVGGAILVAQNVEDMKLRAVAMLMALVGIFSSWRIR